jgi:hypothetical protein
MFSVSRLITYLHDKPGHVGKLLDFEFFNIKKFRLLINYQKKINNQHGRLSIKKQ